MVAIASVVADATIDTAAIVADGRLAQVGVCQTHDMSVIVTQHVAAAAAAADAELILPRTSNIESLS